MATPKIRKKFFEFPEGFLGWAGDIITQTTSVKMYESQISESYIRQQYQQHVQHTGLESLMLKFQERWWNP